MTKSKKTWTLLENFGTGYSQTSEILTVSISTLFLEMTNPRYSILFCSNSHFSGWKKGLYSTKTSKTCYTALTYFSRVQVKIRMLFQYITTIPAMIKSWKILFIIIWKVAGLLVLPKNITRDSKRPLLVWKAAFYSSLGLIQTLLNFQQTFSFVKYLTPQSWEKSSEMSGSEY